MKKIKYNPESAFYQRQHQDSEELCACGCGIKISVRTAKAKAKGATEGYIKGHTWKGKTLPEEAKEKMKLNHADFTGSKNPNYGKGLFGDSNPNWQGGKTLLYINNNQPGINTNKDYHFRQYIKGVDGKCLLCGSKTDLNMHHIESWVDAPELRFDEKNCITLCKKCHCRVDNITYKEEYKPILKKLVLERSQV